MKVIDLLKFRDIVSFGLAMLLGLIFEFYVHKSTFLATEVTYNGLISHTYHSFSDTTHAVTYDLYNDSEFLFGIYEDDVLKSNMTLVKGEVYTIEYVSPLLFSWLYSPRLKTVIKTCSK
jgi:hypothetical protein